MEIWEALKGGTYDFEKDPSGVLIGWIMLDGGASKADVEKMLNQTISDKVYEDLISKISGDSTKTSAILYGKDGDGRLVAKYAGYVMLNFSENALYYNFLGVNPENEEDYGEHIYSELRFR